MHQNFDKMSIGSKVIKIRKLKNLSQKMLADRAGVSQSMISSLESDKNDPGVNLLIRIAKELKVDVNELISDDSIKPKLSDKDAGQIHGQVIGRQIPENVIKALLSIQQRITELLEEQRQLLESTLKQTCD